MIKRSECQKLSPDDVVCSTRVFRVIDDACNRECIYIQTNRTPKYTNYIIISSDGAYTFYKFALDDTFSVFGNDCDVYECAIDNIDVEYH